ncbi:MAG: hypothetical protein OXU68_10235 [Bacteroidota bacterium]|nr:hypothetical protein [Bacteroidota bacterium]
MRRSHGPQEDIMLASGEHLGTAVWSFNRCMAVKRNFNRPNGGYVSPLGAPHMIRKPIPVEGAQTLR